MTIINIKNEILKVLNEYDSNRTFAGNTLWFLWDDVDIYKLRLLSHEINQNEKLSKEQLKKLFTLLHERVTDSKDLSCRLLTDLLKTLGLETEMKELSDLRSKSYEWNRKGKISEKIDTFVNFFYWFAMADSLTAENLEKVFWTTDKTYYY